MHCLHRRRKKNLWPRNNNRQIVRTREWPSSSSWKLHHQKCTCNKSYLINGRRGDLMVSALDSGSSGPGSSPGLGHCVVSLGKTLSTQEYKWVPAKKCWEVTCDGLASHPGEVAILLVGFMLRKPGQAPAVWASLARVWLYLPLPSL